MSARTSGSLTVAEVVASATRRLSEHIARHGIDDRALAICSRYEREYAAAVARAHPLALAPSADDDLTAVLDAIGEVAS